MASRWMAQKRQQQRQYRKRLGNLSLTKAEKKFYNRKVVVNRKTGRIVFVETPEDHTDRMRKEARQEQLQPKEEPRVIARILQLKESIRLLPLDKFERDIIHNLCKRPDVTIAQLERAILRYRRLTKRLELEEKKPRFQRYSEVLIKQYQHIYSPEWEDTPLEDITWFRITTAEKDG